MKRAVFTTTVVGLALVSASACSQLPVKEVAEPAGSQSQPQSRLEAPPPSDLRKLETNLPFELFTVEGGKLDVAVWEVEASPQAEEGVDYAVLGASAPSGALPGPMPRTLVSANEAFGVAIDSFDAETAFLEDITFSVGLIDTDGEYSPLPEVSESLEGLAGSNPEGLTFEPQHASANYPWVVWREGSAGETNAMPTLDSDDWRVITWNQETGEVLELMSAYDLHGDRFAPWATWDIAPTTDGETVYFEATTPSEQGWENSVIATPLDKPGEVEILATGISPVAKPAGGGAYWVEPKEQLILRVTDNSEPLFEVGGEGWQIGRIAASEELLVATVTSEDSAWLLVWDLGADRPLGAVDTGSTWAEASVWGRTFVWGNGAVASNPMMSHWDEDEGVKTLWEMQGLSVPLIYDRTLVVPAEDAEGAVVWRFLEWE